MVQTTSPRNCVVFLFSLWTNTVRYFAEPFLLWLYLRQRVPLRFWSQSLFEIEFCFVLISTITSRSCYCRLKKEDHLREFMRICITVMYFVYTVKLKRVELLVFEWVSLFINSLFISNCLYRLRNLWLVHWLLYFTLFYEQNKLHRAHYSRTNPTNKQSNLLTLGTSIKKN